MATAVTPLAAFPTTSGAQSGSVAATSPMIRLSAVLTSAGATTLQLIRLASTNYWVKVKDASGNDIKLELQHSGGTDLNGASKSVDIQVSDTASYHVVNLGNMPTSAMVVYLESLAPSTGIVVPSITGDTLALLNATQSLAAKTLVTPVIATGLSASGSAANDFSASTGDFLSSTGALTWAGASGKAASLVATGAAMTITADASSVWSTTTGTLGLAGAGGVNLKFGSTILLDVGVTSSTATTLAANKSLVGAAGTGAVTLGSMTGAMTLPTGSISWAGASTKTLSLVGAAAVTLTAGASSTWSTSAGALTLTSAAAATWSTAAGALTLNGFSGMNLQAGGATLLDVGVTTGSTVTLASGTSLVGAAAMTITAAGASTWSTSSGALTVDSAAALNLGTSNATAVNIGHGTIGTVITSTSAAALSVGPNGATNPVLKVNANTASAATGLSVTGAAAAAGVALAVISSGSAENLTIAAKGTTGTVTFQPAIAVPAGGSAAASILLSSTAALGLYTGSGAPSVTAAKGSLYLRTDGSSSSTRIYSASDNAGTWVAVTTAS